MSLLDSLGLNGVFGQNQLQSNQGAFQRAQQYGQYGGQMGQSLMQQQYNQALMASMMQNRPQWVFNGVTCNSPREMADIIWTNDCPEKTHFLLKYE